MTLVAKQRWIRNTAWNVSPEVCSVPLDRLPEGFKFPPSLADRIWFDREQRRLAFRGFMSKATYDQLDELTGDTAYQRAIEELFRRSAELVPHDRPRRLPLLLPIAALITLALVAITTLALPFSFLAAR